MYRFSREHCLFRKKNIRVSMYFHLAAIGVHFKYYFDRDEFMS